MKVDPNAPAYPCETMHESGGRLIHPGMTKRERFAMAAMQGYCANPAAFGISVEDTVRGSVEIADALIAELNREEEDPKDAMEKPD